MGMRELAQLDSSGDIKTIWDSDKPEEVAHAKQQFKDLKDKGFSIFRVGKDGKAQKRMDEFDPDAESMIAVPRVVAG